MISRSKTLKINSFFPFNFAITKICVAIRLAEDGTRMGYSFDYPLVKLIFCSSNFRSRVVSKLFNAVNDFLQK